MATLEKIRSKAGLLVLVVGVALFAFIIGDFLNSGSTYFRQSQETVAEVDGEVIKIQEFQDRVDENADRFHQSARRIPDSNPSVCIRWYGSGYRFE